MRMITRIFIPRGITSMIVMYDSDVNFNVLIAQKTHLRYLGNLEHPMAQELIDAIKKRSISCSRDYSKLLLNLGLQ